MDEKQESSEEDAKKVYTEAEMEAMRKNTVKFYKDKIEVLTLQLKHENLLADIEESQLRQLVALSRKMQMMAQPDEPGAEPPAEEPQGTPPTEEPPTKDSTKPPKKKRELKTD